MVLPVAPLATDRTSEADAGYNPTMGALMMFLESARHAIADRQLVSEVSEVTQSSSTWADSVNRRGSKQT